MCKTLYVTDLDGTLLNSEQRVSCFTAETINALVRRGMAFSYATSRSKVTASHVTENILTKIPVIVYNGTFIMSHPAGDILYANYFAKNDWKNILEQLLRHEVSPIVYSYQNGNEKFSYLSHEGNTAARAFIDTRKNDPRATPVANTEALFLGDIFYFTCIDRAEKLAPLYHQFKQDFSCVCSKDIYTGDQWLEIMPQGVNKASAILRLKEILGCERIISFGDGINDIPMFRISDECYAVENADDELKPYATAIIAGNNTDGVAKWLLENAVW